MELPPFFWQIQASTCINYVDFYIFIFIFLYRFYIIGVKPVVTANNVGTRSKRAALTSNLGAPGNSGFVRYSEATQTRYITAQLTEFKGEFLVGDGNMYNGYYNAPLVEGQQYNIYYGVRVTRGEVCTDIAN